jgi:FKBP-type peptidyl-prolyl cis-trans isomerase FkpA
VAQSGSALQWGCRGRGFKSRRPDWNWQAGTALRRSLLYLPLLVLAILGLSLVACGGDRETVTRDGFSPTLNIDTGAFTRTPSGLRYQELARGQGAEAKAGSKVSVHYTGWLPNGEKFDSSRDRNEPFGFTLGAGQVIAGWDEGVAGMKAGGRRKLIIPADLGYGTSGAPPDIPPGATLVFDVELLEVR